MILFHVKVVCTGQIGTTSEFECEVGIIQRCQNIRNNGLLVNIDAEDLALLVHANDTVCCIVLGCYKDGFSGDTVHIDTCARFKVV